MFYSKYRPQKFSDLVGLETLSKAILTALSAGNLAHAYFFYGPRGTGKTSVARLIAKAVNCSTLSNALLDIQPRLSQGARDLHKGLKTNPNERSVDILKSLDVCGECFSCKAIEKGRFLDLIEIDAASNRGIDDIRALRDKINLAPTYKKAKVYIIDEVHMLTPEAFNALLKTLEEPPKRVYFVLCTTDPQRVPDTIKSRCVKFEFKRARKEDIVKKLEKILNFEKKLNPKNFKKVPKDDLNKIASAAVGGFRDAETLLEQVLVGGSDVDDVISGGGDLSIDDFIDSLKEDVPSSISIIHKAEGSGVDLAVWGLELLKYLRALLLIKAGISKEDLDVSEDKFELMRGQAKNFTILKLAELIDIFSGALAKIKNSALPALPLEVAAVKWFESFSVGPGSGEKGGSAGGEGNSGKLPGVQEVQKVEKPAGENVPLRWEELLKAVRPYNHSVEALLKGCRMVSFEGDILRIEAFYSFHKERLESPKNRQIVENVLKELLGRDVRLKCILGKRQASDKILTDKNISAPKEGDVKEAAKSVLEVFDGGVDV